MRPSEEMLRFARSLAQERGIEEARPEFGRLARFSRTRGCANRIRPFAGTRPRGPLAEIARQAEAGANIITIR